MQRRSLVASFGDAFRGIGHAIRTQRNAKIQLAVGGAAIIAGVVLRVSLVEIALILLTSAGVLAAEIVNTAVETQTTANPSGLRQSSSAASLPQPAANVSITKTVEDAKPFDGSTDTYVVTATNAGPDAAKKVIVTDALPTGITYLSATASSGAVSELTVDGRPTVSWRLASLADGATATLRIVTTIGASSGTVTNTATETQATANPLGHKVSSVAITPRVKGTTVPPAHTGEPWSAWLYWFIVAMMASVGAIFVETARRWRKALRFAGTARSD